MTTIATTQSGWKAKIFFVGKAKDWTLQNEKEHKKRVISAGTEITQNKDLTKSSITNYSTESHLKKVVISCL